MEKRIRFGLIGCGRISIQHLAAFDLVPQAKLVAVCDVLPERAEKIAKERGVDHTTDYRKILERDDVDVVSICTPNGTHLAIASDAAKSGKHAIVEKPLAFTEEEVKQMAKTFASAGKILFPVLQVRYNPPIQVVRQVIKDGRLGKILNAAVVIRWTRPQSYFDNDAWRGTKAMDGGSLLNQGIHYLDILQWVLGPVRSVFGKVDTLAHKIEIEDFALALVRFSSGAYGTIEFSLNTYPRNIEGSITIMGEKGTIKIGGAAMNKIEFWEVDQLPMPQIPEGIAPNVYAGGMYQGSCPNHFRVYEDVCAALNGEKKEYVDVNEALNAVRIADALYVSAREGKEVTVGE